MIVLDTSGLLAAIDGSQRDHRRAAAALRASGEPRLLSPFVLAELDYLLTTRVSGSAALALLQQVADGAYRIVHFGPDEVQRAVEVLEQYRDLGIGLADASLVVIAERFDTLDLLTLDERHFRALKRRDGRAFRLLPADTAGSPG